VSVTGITTLKNYFKTTEKRSCAPGVFNLPVFNFYFYAQVTLNSWDRVNDDSCHVFAPFEKLISFLI
jgi:hypothetical protein